MNNAYEHTEAQNTVPIITLVNGWMVTVITFLLVVKPLYDIKHT